MHSVLQTAANQRQLGESIDGAAIARLWATAWDAAASDKGKYAELREIGEDQLRRYIASEAWETAHITAVESSFRLPLDSGDVSGRYDRIDMPPGGRPTVVDYKTGPPKDEESMRRDLQVRAYAVALAQREQTDNVAVELHNLQTTEVTQVLFGKKELERAYRHLSASVSELAGSWQTGNFPPRPSSYACRRCEYRTICDEGRETEK